MTVRTRALIEAMFSGIRDGWLIIGAAVLLLVALEISTRIVLSLRTADEGGDATSIEHPYAAAEWFSDWERNRRRHAFGWYIDYAPYQGWEVRPGEYEGLHILPSGYRRTIQADTSEGPAKRPVLLFGGSTMWGYTARDHATIPSWVARQLAEAQIDDVRVYSRAQVAYNVTQGLATLLLELRSGSRPVAAVFLDGVNEIGPIVAGGRPGEIYLEAEARRRFASGKESTLALVLRLAGRSKLVAAVSPKRAPALPEIDAETDCDLLVDHYANLVRAGVALGSEFDFEILFFWQPTLAMTGKDLGPWEKIVMTDPGVYGTRMLKMQRACAAKINERMEPLRGSAFFSLEDVFDGVEGDQFLDHYGHVTEAANSRIAEAITEQLIPVLRDIPPSSRRESRGGKGIH